MKITRSISSAQRERDREQNPLTSFVSSTLIDLTQPGSNTMGSSSHVKNNDVVNPHGHTTSTSNVGVSGGGGDGCSSNDESVATTSNAGGDGASGGGMVSAFAALFGLSETDIVG